MFNRLKKTIPLVFDKWLFISIFFSFIALAVVLTLSHEGGHYAVARSLGYKASINYGKTFWKNDKYEQIHLIWLRNQDAIGKNLDFPEKKIYEEKLDDYNRNYKEKYRHDEYLIIWGGPLETMLTGSIGLFFLFLYQQKIQVAEKLNIRQWLLIFLTLFWVRQPVNTITWLFSYYVLGKTHLPMDELFLAGYLHMPRGIIAIGSGLLGLIILSIILFFFIPLKQRLTFILGSLFGGVAGYVLWLIIVGPKIMP